MKKLLGILSAFTLAVAPASTLVACGQHHKGDQEPTTDPAAVFAQLSSKVYSALLTQYKGKANDFSHLMDGSFKKSWINEDNFAKLFEGTTGDSVSLDTLSGSDNESITKDINDLLNVSELSKAINGIVSNNKWYDGILSGIQGKKIFNKLLVTPKKLSRMMSTDNGKSQAAIYQFEAEVVVSYSTNVTGSNVDNNESSKVGISFMFTSAGAISDYLNWVTKEAAEAIYTAPDSPLRITNLDLNSKGESTTVLGPNGKKITAWHRNYANTFLGFKDKLNGYVKDQLPGKLTATLNDILSNPEDHGYKGTDIQLSSDNDVKIDPDAGETFGIASTFGEGVDYQTTSPIDPTSTKDDDTGQASLAAVALGDYDSDKMTDAILAKASTQYTNVMKNSQSLSNSKIHPLNSVEASKNFATYLNTGFIDAEGIIPQAPNNGDWNIPTGGQNEEPTKINMDTPYAYGNIQYANVPIYFANYSGTFNLQINLPWSFSFANAKTNVLMPRSEDFIGLMESVLTLRTRMNFKYFTTSNNHNNVFMKRDLYYRGEDGKGTFASATNDKTNPDAYSKWNAVKDIAIHLDNDSVLADWEVLGQRSQQVGSLGGYAQSTAALNISDKAALPEYKNWASNKSNLVNLAYTIDNYYRAKNSLFEMSYKQQNDEWDDGDNASNWELRAYDKEGDEDNFQQVTNIGNKLRLSFGWMSKDALKKPFSILGKNISNVYDYVYGDQCLFLADNDYDTK